jgi:hypothetical protein
MKVMVLEEALTDLAAGYRFYERQSEGLGIYFIDTLWSDMDSLRFLGGIHYLHFGYYRMLSKRFPFAVYYRIEAEVVRVRAVLDCRRNPAWTRKRLK